MSMKQIDRFKTFTAHFRVEVDPAGGESAHFHDREHALGGQIDIGRELISIPAQHGITRVGINGA